MTETAKTACVIIIGNEILSGRTQDTNLNWLGKELNALGVRLIEARVIPDIPDMIVDTVNHCRRTYDYVFTTGGIGPTHDDITAENIAKAFGVPLIRHPEAEAILTRHYGVENLNAARLKMADIPQGAELIANPVSAAPGFILENVYVMAGVPRIMQAMFDSIKHTLVGGAPVQSITVSVLLPEGVIAENLTKLQYDFTDVEIGSYPFIRDGKLGASLVMRAVDAERLAQCSEQLRGMLFAMGGNIVDDEA